MNHHAITNQLLDWQGHRLFTDAGFEKVILPQVDRMPGEGGCIAIVLDWRPDRRNFCDVAVSSFTGEERKTLRKALERARKRREDQNQPQ